MTWTGYELNPFVDTMNIVDSRPLNHEKVESQVGTGKFEPP